MEAIIKLSVKNLVEFAMKSGSIDSGFASMKSAVDGGKGHRAVQKQRVEENEQYLSEVPVSISITGNGVLLQIGGRIDGILINGGSYIIEEIKTTERQLALLEPDHNELHWAQAICYAYIYANQNNLSELGIQLTYYNRSTKQQRSFERSYPYLELEAYFLELVRKYLKWAELVNKWNIERQISITQTTFPFETYRSGQREFAIAVYKTFLAGKRLFAKAPTGIGKTIAAIFPAVKAVGEGQLEKIFYLTAKTSTRQLAEEAFDRLRSNGLKFRTVTITAKEKACLMDKVSCKPEDCPYADGYYDRIDYAIEEILEKQSFDRDTIHEHGIRHKVCPFELSLDLSLFSDGIICDYNYVFDPRVYLKRFFSEGKTEHGFLIDEAHNLVDRARGMYSAELLKSRFLAIKAALKPASTTLEPEKSANKRSKRKLGLPEAELKKTVNEINAYFIAMRKELEQENLTSKVTKLRNGELDGLLENFLASAERVLEQRLLQAPELAEKLLELYFDTMNYLRTIEDYDDKYVTYVERDQQELRIKLFCIDPSRLLDKAMKRGKSTILFSATLSPLEYFRSMLGGSNEKAGSTSSTDAVEGLEQEDFRISIPSPFDRSKLCLIAANNINTTFKVREQSYRKVAEYISLVASAKKGNYFVFFPSYKYLKEVHEVFCQDFPRLNTLVQRSDMTEQQREEFLSSFQTEPEQSTIGFAVLGGAFGEGIDLTGDRLIGAIIVGVGLPQLCLERDIIRDHFSQVNGLGFEYAYSYPGMNKVLQAAGRVIRTEQDRGVVFLIDQRFSRNEYRSMMPPEWQELKWVKNSDMVIEELQRFWRI